MVENLELFLSIAVTVISLFLSSITFLIKLIKNIKARKELDNLLKISNEIIPFIEEAEKLINYSGQEKKEYVITRITQFALSNKIELNQEEINEIIETFISLTKNVNIKSSKNDLKKILNGNE